MLKLDRYLLHLVLPISLCALSAPLATAQMPSATADSASASVGSLESLSALDSAGKSLYLMGVTAQWQTHADGRNYAFLQAAVDSVVTPSGELRLSPAQALPFGRAILLCFRVSGDQRLLHAAKQLRDSLQPQADKGDMSFAPFLADFGVTTGDAPAAEQAADILLRIDTSGRDLETGLLRNAELPRNTLYALDLLETINRLPIGFHHRRGLTEALNKTVSALIARRDNHAVWQTPNQPPETLLLNAYIVACAVRFGELAESDSTLAREMADLAHSTSLSESSAGAAMLAASEADQVATQSFGQGRTVVADAWFAIENRSSSSAEAAASLSRWDDDTDHGLSFFGYTFQRFGMQLDTLRAAPTSANLSSAQVYVIASGQAQTHEMSRKEADSVEAWVRDGGVLVLLQRTTRPEDLAMLNGLSDRFGMHFAPGADSSGTVATAPVSAASSVFLKSKHLLLPGAASLNLSAPAHATVKNGEMVAVAVASVGRGTVLAIANPWLFNEYLDGRRASAPSENFAPAIELAGWLLKQTQQ